MRELAALISGALALAPAPALAQDFCDGLRRIAAAAQEPEPFASLAGEARLLPGFEGTEGGCDVRRPGWRSVADISCNRRFAPESLSEARLAERVRACLGAEFVPGPNDWTRGYYRTPHLDIRIDSDCDDSCQVGRTGRITLSVRREGDGNDAAR